MNIDVIKTPGATLEIPIVPSGWAEPLAAAPSKPVIFTQQTDPLNLTIQPIEAWQTFSARFF